MEADGNQQAEAHTWRIQHPLGYHKADGEEKIRRRNEREHHQRQALQQQKEQCATVFSQCYEDDTRSTAIFQEVTSHLGDKPSGRQTSGRQPTGRHILVPRQPG